MVVHLGHQPINGLLVPVCRDQTFDRLLQSNGFSGTQGKLGAAIGGRREPRIVPSDTKDDMALLMAKMADSRLVLALSLEALRFANYFLLNYN